MPAVSVIIPAFNASKYITQAIQSVLAQSFKDYEIIVVNDCAPDSLELERALDVFRTNIVYLRRDQNGGPGAARNTGIGAARGQFIAFLDADDHWEPNFLAEQVGQLTQHPEASLIYSDVFLFLEGTRNSKGRFFDSCPSRCAPDLNSLLSQDCTVATSTVVARKQVVIEAGLFDPTIGKYSEDFDLYLRIAGLGALLLCQRKPLAHHRIHPASLTAVPGKILEGTLRVLDKATRTMSLTKEQQELAAQTKRRIEVELHLVHAHSALDKRDFREAVRRIRVVNRLRPTFKGRLIALALMVLPDLVFRIQQRTRGR